MNTLSPTQQHQQSKRVEQQQNLLQEKLRKVLKLLGEGNKRALATPKRGRLKNTPAAADYSAAQLAELLYSKAPFDFVESHSSNELAALARRTQESLSRFLLKPRQALLEYEHTALFTRFFILRPDCPFIVTSITEVLREFNIFMRAYLHPILARGQSYVSISLIEVPLLDEETSQRICKRIRVTLGDLSLVTEDFPQMRQLTGDTGELSGETSSFLQWLSEGAFLFCGAIDWSATQKQREVQKTYGLTRSTQSYSKALLAELNEDVTKLLAGRHEMFAARLSVLSPIHRRSRLFHIAVRIPSQKRVISLIGLMTSLARGLESSRLMIIRRKMEAIFSLRKILNNSYDYKHVVKLIDNMPLEDALRLSTSELSDLVRRSLDVASTDSTQVAVFYEPLGRGVTVAIALPRDRFTSGLRGKLQAHVEKSFGVAPDLSAYLIDVSDKFFYRLYFSVPFASTPKTLDLASFERITCESTKSWKEQLRDLVYARYPTPVARDLWASYGEAFAENYQVLFTAQDALQDIVALEGLDEACPWQLGLEGDTKSSTSAALKTLVLYHRGSEVSLSKALPILEQVGLEVLGESAAQISPKEKATCAVHRYRVRFLASTSTSPAGLGINPETFARYTAPGLCQVFAGKAAQDPLNRLLMAGSFTVSSLSLLRTYASLLSQLNKFATRHAIFNALATYPDCAQLLWNAFETRFNPTLRSSQAQREQQIAKLAEKFGDLLSTISDLATDRILRGLLSLLQATVRTNFYQNPKAIAIKVHSELCEVIPSPRPLFEIFVSSPRVEGIHLRSGLVARGGIRWSDRKDDYRTEVLGLMRTQRFKNVVTVPTGAKGGFILRNSPEDPQALRKAVSEAYQEFIRALLSLADNRQGERVLHPEGLLCYDQFDPYFVVAADKGTASFSDLANSIASNEFKFWLDDAFASGGSNGYDHKLYAITARGAWECTQRHFLQLGLDWKRQDFTAVGIGDMSGDVFGNGLLLSKRIKLLGAFDHRHIFVDPSPDAGRSFAERKRLFDLPTSSWADYQASAISKGGGVFPRLSKEIVLSPELRAALQVPSDTPKAVSGEQLIMLILRAPVDLLWNGGIGTYVKSVLESQADVNDSANDRVRINANELRARVVTEGGNLGFTQRARIEYALGGGLINTDAIDNSGGVDLSDHEVNTKILLAPLVHSGRISRTERNILLKTLAKDMCELVLGNNRTHAVGLSLSQERSVRNFEYTKALIRELDGRGYLSRLHERLPSDDELNDREAAQQPLTRPELAIIMAAVKIWLKEQIVTNQIFKEPALQALLMKYFPEKVVKRFPKEVAHHPLAAHLITTQLVHQLVFSGGISYVFRMAVNHSVGQPVVIRAHIVASETLALARLQDELKVLANVAHNAQYLACLQVLSRAIRAATSWFISTYGEKADVSALIKHYQPRFEQLYAKAEEILAGEDLGLYQQQLAQAKALGLSKAAAQQYALMPLVTPALEILWASQASGRPLPSVARTFAAVSDILGVNLLVTFGKPVETKTRWEKELRVQSFGEIRRSLSSLVVRLLEKKIKADSALLTTLRSSPSFAPFLSVLREMKEQTPSVAALSVVAKHLRVYQV